MASASNDSAPTSLYEAFMTETMSVVSKGETKERKISELYSKYANLYYVAYAVAGYCDKFSRSSDPHDQILLQGFKKIHIDSENYPHGIDISISEMANQILDIYDAYREKEFIETVLLRTHFSKMGFYPNCEEGERQLGSMSNPKGQKITFTQLVKCFRYCLSRTVSGFFNSKSDSSTWEPKNAYYRVRYDNGELSDQRTGVEFVSVVEQILEMYDHVVELSNDLSEYKAIEDEAISKKNVENSKETDGQWSKPKPRLRIRVVTTSTAKSETSDTVNRFEGLVADE